MATAPQYAATPNSQVTAIPATANTARDGTGTLVTISPTSGASGMKVERVKFKATGTTTAGMIRLFLHNGTSAFLHEEIPVLAVTPSASVETWEGEILFDEDRPLVIPTGWGLRATTHVAEAFHATVISANF